MTLGHGLGSRGAGLTYHSHHQLHENRNKSREKSYFFSQYYFENRLALNMTMFGIGNKTVKSPLIGYYDVTGFFYLPGASQVDGAPDELLGVIHPHWYNFPPQNQMWNGIMALVYFILWGISTFGNLAVLAVFFKTKSLQTPANILVANLAFADFFMMLTQAPWYILNAFRSRWWSFGIFACELYGFTGGLSGIGAIMTMVVIGLDRFLVLTQGFSGKRLSQPMAIALIGFVWIYSMSINLPPLLRVWSRYVPEGMLTTCSFDYLQDDWFNKSYVIFIFSFAYVIPLLLLIFFYSKIVATVFLHEKSLRDQAKKMNVDSLRSNVDQNEASVELKIAKAAMSSVLLWVSIWTPYALVVLIGAFGDRMLISPLVSQLPSLCCKFASCANPLVFAITHPKFKVALRREFPKLYCGSPEKEPELDANSSRASMIKP